MTTAELNECDHRLIVLWERCEADFPDRKGLGKILFGAKHYTSRMIYMCYKCRKKFQPVLEEIK